MTTTRIGRRQRNRRHKAKARRHPIRTWPLLRLGREFSAMEAFIDEPQDHVVGPDGDLIAIDPRYPWLEIARCSGVSAAYAREWEPPEVTIERWRIVRRSEGRLFYEDRNRRYRKLMQKLAPL